LAGAAFTAMDTMLVGGGALIAVVGYVFFNRVAPHVDDYL